MSTIAALLKGFRKGTTVGRQETNAEQHFHHFMVGASCEVFETLLRYQAFVPPGLARVIQVFLGLFAHNTVAFPSTWRQEQPWQKLGFTAVRRSAGPIYAYAAVGLHLLGYAQYSRCVGCHC